jgi:aryl-alcohol dehydrogenase-like predicted oxidoreductase
VETALLGNSGISVSRIGLGTWAIGGKNWGGTDRSDAIATIQSAVDRGITLIDTAPAYGLGESERLVGEAVGAGGRRDRAIIATKAGLDWSQGNGLRRDSRPDRLRQELEDSLRRLRTDRIDLYQIHWPDPLVPIEDTARELDRMFRSGKIRAIGVSNYDSQQMEAFRSVAPLHAVQPPYNLFESAADQDVLPYAKANGLTVLAYGALCRGLLTGRITEQTQFSGDDLRRSDPKFADLVRRDQYLGAVRSLNNLARERFNRDVLALAVRWVLDRGPTVALWGARRPDQLDPVHSVMGWTIDDETMLAIDAILKREIWDPVGPEFMAPPTRLE